MFFRSPFSSPPNRNGLSEEQKRMYAAEKLDNFRYLSRMVATRSPYVLTRKDAVSSDVVENLSLIGQFAELCYSAVPIQFLLDNLPALCEKGYPLEGFSGLQDVSIVSIVCGTVAELPVLVLYKATTKQLVVAISGTASPTQALQDLRVLFSPHPSGRGTVHTGFLGLYQGIKDETQAAIRRGLRDFDVDELVLTGHSMGGSLAYLLCIDHLAERSDLPPELKLKIAVFGAPRTGNEKLVNYFHELKDQYMAERGNGAFTELSVKGFNDGVPALPPLFLGYRHFCRQALYLSDDYLFQVPTTESEHGSFSVSLDSPSQSEIRKPPQFPRGGHNYYNGRDLERWIRRVNWLAKSDYQRDGWEGRYQQLLHASDPPELKT